MTQVAAANRAGTEADAPHRGRTVYDRRGADIQFHHARIRPYRTHIVPKVSLSDTRSKVDISLIEQIRETNPENLEDDAVSNNSNDLMVCGVCVGQERHYVILQKRIDTSPHGDDRLLIGVRRLTSPQTIRGTDAGSRSTGLPPCTLKGAVLLLPETRDLYRGQQRAACQLLLADSLRRFRSPIKIRGEHMSEADPPIPEASSEETDLRLTVLCQVVAIFIASADADDMPGLSAAFLLRSQNTRTLLVPHYVHTLRDESNIVSSWRESAQMITSLMA